MDIVEWLRDTGDHARFEPSLHHKAADEIERLRDAMRAIATISDCHENARQIARAALGEEK